MATNSTTNGTNLDAVQDVSPAQRLQEKHLNDATHRPMVEDAVDEEDIAHPPPSALVAPPESPTANEDVPPPMSEKAAGKQKARDEPADSAPPDAHAPPAVVLDTKSEDAFPALGGGPKSRNQAPVAMAWGARKPLGVANAMPNGINGQGPTFGSTSPRVSTPISGNPTPSSTTPSTGPRSQGPSIPQYIPMPGRHSERIQFGEPIL